ncbi:uncharacterized protein PAC_06652 [Phialocephala subalpina]|uniref:Heterokaryon incompatibility domain-containing protein n=1 Tax=Phialocephala subalpina TaxID=576137 RepID=A0A1L7WVJ5_9HELO|nr:uncharacterized protein PAC_06652 [Phialocephala subalpina]
MNIGQIERAKDAKEKPRLGELMIRFAPWKATDLKDKVYALFGFSGDAKELNIIANYSLRLHQVWASAYRAILLQEQDFEILGLARCGHEVTTRTPELRSWIPDLASPPSSVPFSYNASTNEYKASGDTKARISFTQDVLGRMLPTILGMVEKGNFALMHSWIEELLSLAVEYCELEGRDFKEENFWRSLIGNVTGNGEIAPECYGDYFNSYREYQKLIYVFMQLKEIHEKVEDMKGFIQQREAFGMDSQLVKEAELFEFAISKHVQKRRFCITEQGRYGFEPKDTGSDFGRTIGEDYVCILAGSPVSCAIRRPLSGDQGNSFKNGWLLGEAYVHSPVCKTLCVQQFDHGVTSPDPQSHNQMFASAPQSLAWQLPTTAVPRPCPRPTPPKSSPHTIGEP